MQVPACDAGSLRNLTCRCRIVTRMHRAESTPGSTPGATDTAEEGPRSAAMRLSVGTLCLLSAFTSQGSTQYREILIYSDVLQGDVCLRERRESVCSPSVRRYIARTVAPQARI